MNTSEYIQKLAAYKIAIATGEMEVGKTKSVGEQAGEPEPIQKKPFMGRLADKFKGELDTAVVEILGRGLEEYGNLKTDQATPIGELFSDFANDQLKKKKGMKGNIYYSQSFPRSYLEGMKNPNELKNIAGSLVAPKTEAYSGLVLDSEFGNPSIVENAFNTPIHNNMIKELATGKKPDRLTKALKAGDDWAGGYQRAKNLLMRNGVPENQAEIQAIGATWQYGNLFKDAKGIVVTPRNNLRSLAHEYGHIESELGVEKLGPTYNFFRTVLSDPMESIYGKVVPDKIKAVINDKIYPKVTSVIGTDTWNQLKRLALGSERSLPLQAVLATKAMDVIAPETMDKLKEKDPTGVLDFIDEHPTASAIIAELPHIGREAATTIPGTKMTYEFWKALKDGNNEFMKNHVFADEVRQGLKDLSKVNPSWEAAKFLGKNVAKTTFGITAPLLGLYAAGKIRNWLGKKDDN